MLGFTVGVGTAVVAGRSAADAQRRVDAIQDRANALLARNFSDPETQRLRDVRLQIMRFEQTSPAYVAHRSGRAAVAGALIAAGSLIGGPLYAATRG